MRRIGLVSRIALFLMVVLIATIVAAISLDDWRRAHWRRPLLQRASHMAQTAAIIDTVMRASHEDVPTVLRAVSGSYVRADIFTVVPPQGRLVEAPHVAAKVRSLMRTPAPELHAYTDGVQKGLAYPGEGLEGVIRRAVLPLPSGRYLVVGVIVIPPAYSTTVLGLPSGFWIGLLGVLVAALALLAALRELAPLQRLTEAVTRFDGQQPLLAEADQRDTSDIGRLVRAVGEMQERIATLLRERSFLIGAISHDAKTYLTRLRLRAEEVEDASRRAALIRNIDAISELLDTSLAYARGTTSAHRRERLDLADLAAAEIAEREAVGEHRIVARPFADTALVEGDPVALKRVVANLIDNAVKFGRERIEVEVEVASEGAGSLLRVGDDGPGIPEPERDLVFSPFYRLEKSRSRQTGGTGLGLAIARQIVEAHGGAISIERSPLGGALLVVRLPAATASARPAHHAVAT